MKRKCPSFQLKQRFAKKRKFQSVWDLISKEQPILRSTKRKRKYESFKPMKRRKKIFPHEILNDYLCQLKEYKVKMIYKKSMQLKKTQNHKLFVYRYYYHVNVLLKKLKE